MLIMILLPTAEDVNKGALNNIAECDMAGTNNMDNSPETHTHIAGKIFQVNNCEQLLSSVLKDSFDQIKNVFGEK